MKMNQYDEELIQKESARILERLGITQEDINNDPMLNQYENPPVIHKFSDIKRYEEHMPCLED